MGFDLNAFLGRASELRTWKGRLPSAVVCPLSGDLGLVPVTATLAEELRGWAVQKEVGGSRASSPPSSEEAALRWGARASAGTAVVYVSTGEFGDRSYEEATLWSNGREVLTRVLVPAALAQLRAETGLDLGTEPLDLGLYRGETAAEKWAAAAVTQG